MTHADDGRGEDSDGKDREAQSPLRTHNDQGRQLLSLSLILPNLHKTLYVVQVLFTVFFQEHRLLLLHRCHLFFPQIAVEKEKNMRA